MHLCRTRVVTALAVIAASACSLIADLGNPDPYPATDAGADSKDDAGDGVGIGADAALDGTSDRSTTPGTCSDGTVEQTFTGAMVGCAGSVAWNDRQALCGPHSRPCTAAEWVGLRAGQQPSHNYWVDDALLMFSTSNYPRLCYASKTIGSACNNGPPHICVLNGPDPEGNNCDPIQCGRADPDRPADLFFGCTGGKAGALCCCSGTATSSTACADGTAEQTFTAGMFGCAGAQPWEYRDDLCGAGCKPCTVEQWTNMRAGASPTHTYWVDDNLSMNSGNGACYVSRHYGTSCTSGGSAAVCVGRTDPEGNTCESLDCGYADIAPPANEFFGNCNVSGASYSHAGTLCCGD